MKDLTSADTFSNNQVEFKKAQKRVIRTSEWDDKLREIQEWIEEQERLKGRQIEDDLGNNDAYEQVTSITPEERQAQMNANRKTPYEDKVEEIRRTLGYQTQGNTTFSAYGQTGHSAAINSNYSYNNQQSESLVGALLGFNFFKGAMLGRELTQLEPDNNKELLEDVDENKNKRPGLGRMGMGLNRGGLLGGQRNKVVESKNDQVHRMRWEDWEGYLGAYRTSAGLTVASGILTALKIKILTFVPSYFALIPALAGVVYLADKLKKNYNDGPLASSHNFLGSDDNVKQEQALYKKQKEAEKKKKESEEKKIGRSFGGGRFGGRHPMRGGLGDNRSTGSSSLRRPSIVSFDDDDEEDDEEEPVMTPEINQDDMPTSSVPSVEKTLQQQRPEPVHDYVDDMTDDDGYVDADKLSELLMINPDNVGKYEVPHSRLKFGNNQEVFEFEEDFLRWVFDNRAAFSKLHKPSELLKVFAPLIPEYNKGFAYKKEVKRESITFKNIVYVLTRTFSEISKDFANANEHDPNFFFCLDKIEETSLFYKIKLRLPQSISKNAFQHKLDVLVNELKSYDGDIVDAALEMANSEGYVKIMKIVVRDGAGYLPLVSSGDVMRFKGMKANRGKTDLIKELDKPNDLSFLVGLNSAEYARVLDIGGNQNTSIAVVGGTGSGKTASLGSWLLNLIATHSPDEVGIIIMDAKSGSFWENFKYTPHVLGYFGREDIEKYPMIYSILSNICTARQNHLNKEVRVKNYTEARKKFKKNLDWKRIMTVPRLIVISDEIAATLASLSNIDDSRKSYNKNVERSEKKYCTFFEEYKTQTRACVQIVREAGITMVGISQRAVDKSFPRDFLSGTTIRLMMKLEFESDAERMSGEKNPPNVANLPTGSGYVRANGLPLSQLTIPLYSGEPDLLEEFTRTMGLAWTIIQSYKENLEKEPPYYYLTQKTSDNTDLFEQYSIEPFNLFNRDKLYQEAKEILKTGHGLHFSDEADEDGSFSIDLDKADNLWSDEPVDVETEPLVEEQEETQVESVNKLEPTPTVEETPADNNPGIPANDVLTPEPEEPTEVNEPSGITLQDILNGKMEPSKTIIPDKKAEKTLDDNVSLDEQPSKVQPTIEKPVIQEPVESESEEVVEEKPTRLNRKPINKPKMVEKPKNEKSHHVKLNKDKNDLTVNDLKQYFINGGFKTMPLDDLMEDFNYSTIKVAINQGVLSIDGASRIVTLL